ncbi:MAG: rRNA maturation RNAse YbeY, partial [Planctomycetota bacterium]|nr:rRNA maturation RNAse YbeY [Planctomycetota bacterium]
GTLHLLGYDDHAPRDRARMHRRQEALLARFLSGSRRRGRGAASRV